jgi:hypothetical protein
MFKKDRINVPITGSCARANTVKGGPIVMLPAWTH